MNHFFTEYGLKKPARIHHVFGKNDLIHSPEKGKTCVRYIAETELLQLRKIRFLDRSGEAKQQQELCFQHEGQKINLNQCPGRLVTAPGLVSPSTTAKTKFAMASRSRTRVRGVIVPALYLNATRLFRRRSANVLFVWRDFRL